MRCLSDHEIRMVGFAAEASGPKSDDAMERIFAWAERVSVDTALFELVVGDSSCSTGTRSNSRCASS